MKYKIIAIDFDGTLLDDNKKISLNNLNAINKKKKEGCYIIAVTARNLSSIKNVCDINIFDYLILNNGCNLYDVKNNSVVFNKIIEKEKYRDIISTITDVSSKIQLCSVNYYYTIGKRDSQYNFHIKIDDYNDITDDICRLNIFFNEKQELFFYDNKLRKIYPDLNIFMMEESGTNLNKNKWLVVNPDNIDKMETLKYLVNILGISMDEVIFFGDGPNDIRILESVGLGVAMENASDDVKKHAKEITLSNNNDGVSYFLEKYITF